MKRLLNSTAALSVALMNVHPWPLMAQTMTDTGAVIAVDGTVLCEPSADAACDPNDDDLIAQAQKIEADMAAAAAAEAAAAEAEAQAKAAADAAAEAEAQAKAAEDAAAVEAEAQAKAAEDAAAEAEAQAKAAEAAAAVEAEAQAKAAADAAAADAEAQAKAAEDAAAEAEAQAKAAEDAAADAEAQAKAAEDAAAADAEAQAKAEAEAEAQAKAAEDAAGEADAEAKAAEDAAAAEAQAESDAAAEAAAQVKAAEDAAAADAEAQAKADAEAKAAAEVPAETEAPADPVAEAVVPEAADLEAETEARAEAEAELGLQEDGTITDPSAGLKTAEEVIDPAAVPVEAPEVTEEAVQTLTNLLTGEGNVTADMAETGQPFAAADTAPLPADAAPSADAVASTSELLTEGAIRRATEEFSAAPQVVAPGKKNKLSDLEKAGLVVLGALAVGTIINYNKNATAAQQQQQQQVVSNTGDRVVVLQPDGTYQVYKDDDALLRQPGNTQRVETYKDGSTRTIMDRPDGTQIVTIRNATGRVLRRAHYDTLGNELLLIDDLAPEQAIVVSNLPKPRNRPVVISPNDSDVALKAALAKLQIEKVGRSFSLRQVREIPQVRHLAAMIDVDKITFASGSSALSTSEINALSELGTVMRDILDLNRGELFLIEGHTDAVGKAAMNLALSDRRAETVALALTEYFDIPPENMVVQGYGETELLIDTQANEKRNRRVAVRLITPLL